MITVTANELYDQVQSQDEEIILNGPPMHLTGNFTLQNNTSEMLFIKELPMRSMAEGKTAFAQQANFPVNTALNPGEVRNHFAWFSMNPQTSPGVYEAMINVGGNEKRVRMVVQENVELELQPSELFFKGVGPGKEHKAEVLLINRGNVPVNIPDIHHSTTLDMDFLCRSLVMAIREKGQEGYNATMDELTRNIHNDIAGWVEVKIDEAGQQLPEGKSMALHFTFKLPEKIETRRDYFGDIRLIDDLVLSYKIIAGG
jgi:hypothetical protein